MIGSEELERRKAICRECPNLRAKAGGAIAFCARDCHRPADGKYCEPYAVRQYQRLILDESTNTTCDRWSLPPSLSVIVATAGRPSLAAAIESLFVAGLTDRDEILVATDRSTSGKIPEANGIVRVVQSDGEGGDYGAAARRAALSVAKGKWIGFCDDDDLYLPGSISAIRSILHSSRSVPVIFRMHHADCGLIWKTPLLRCGNVGGEQFWIPNAPPKIGDYRTRNLHPHCVDFEFMESTMEAYGPQVSPVFHNEITLVHNGLAFLRDA